MRFLVSASLFYVWNIVSFLFSSFLLYSIDFAKIVADPPFIRQIRVWMKCKVLLAFLNRWWLYGYSKTIYFWCLCTDFVTCGTVLTHSPTGSHDRKLILPALAILPNQSFWEHVQQSKPAIVNTNLHSQAELRLIIVGNIAL